MGAQRKVGMLVTDAATPGCEVGVGEPLIRLGVGSILIAITAVALGSVLKSPTILAGSSDNEARIESPRIDSPRISVFGTVHPEIFRLPASAASQPSFDHVRLASLSQQSVASLSPQVESDADEQDVREGPAASAWWNESFDDYFPGPATRVLASDMDFLAQPDDDIRTAIYDIAARSVYLPDGRRLEAHSGLGDFRDNPRHVHVKMRGATPPNVYILSLRKKLFHGVQAIRLTPMDESKMFGRDGMLAHSYMHGANGQSNGCVAFSNYPEFLNFFLKGAVTRLIVVDRLENPPAPTAPAAGALRDIVRNLTGASDRVGQYAAANAPTE